MQGRAKNRAKAAVASSIVVAASLAGMGGAVAADHVVILDGPEVCDGQCGQDRPEVLLPEHAFLKINEAFVKVEIAVTNPDHAFLKLESAFIKIETASPIDEMFHKINFVHND